jgi:predicted dehydrogenase
MKGPVRFGVIACSSIAKRWFLPALCSASVAKLEHIGSRDLAKGQQFAGEFGRIKVGSYEEVLSDPSVDAVYISTPPLLHAEWVFKAAERGKHILCEKPAFPDYATACKAVEACRSAKVRLIENFAFRYHPQHALVAKLLAENRIGDIRLFESEFTYPLPPAGDIRLQPELGGGVFHDSAGYPVAAAMLQLKARPISVFCRLGTYGQVDNGFSVLLNFESGCVGFGYTAFDSYYRSRYSLLGNKGRIEVLRAFSVQPQMTPTVVLETDAGEERFTADPANQFRLLLEDFCAEITASSPGKNFEEDLLWQHAVMDAAARSIKEVGLVNLSEIRRK